MGMLSFFGSPTSAPAVAQTEEEGLDEQQAAGVTPSLMRSRSPSLDRHDAADERMRGVRRKEMGSLSLLDAEVPSFLPAAHDAPRYELRPREHLVPARGAGAATQQQPSITWGGLFGGSSFRHEPIPQLSLDIGPDGGTKLKVEYGDITLWRGDAIVNGA